MADLSKDVLAFSEGLKRMCRAYPGCEGCPAYSELPCDIREVTPELIKAVQKWSDEHPQKTYAQDFREKFPGCLWDDDKPVGVCVSSIYHGVYKCDGAGCRKCWNKPMEQNENVEY